MIIACIIIAAIIIANLICWAASEPDDMLDNLMDEEDDDA